MELGQALGDEQPQAAASILRMGSWGCLLEPLEEDLFLLLREAAARILDHEVHEEHLSQRPFLGCRYAEVGRVGRHVLEAGMGLFGPGS